jgi:hypothetical protein
MATRSRTSFKKRQKEIARMEKQREKAAKRMQRKSMPREPETETDIENSGIENETESPMANVPEAPSGASNGD